MNIRAQIKYWLSLNQSNFEKLAGKMTEITGKKYTRGSLNGKLVRNTLTVREMEIIAKLFGYKLDFIEEK